LAAATSLGGQLTVSCEAHPTESITEGGVVTLTAVSSDPSVSYQWDVFGHGVLDKNNAAEAHWDTTGLKEGSYKATVTVTRTPDTQTQTAQCTNIILVTRRPIAKGDILPVTLRRTANVPTLDLPLWVVIRKSTEGLSFDNYLRFMDIVLCGIGQDGKAQDKFDQLRERRFLPYNDADAYRLLKVATEAFVVVNCAVAPASRT
jgi:hypothetical protein